MDTIGHRNDPSVETVIEATTRAIDEHEKASDRLDSDAKALRPIERSLNSIRDRLEQIAEDEEVLERLGEITIGADGIDLLTQLGNDLSVTCSYLRSCTTPLKDGEVTGYAQALGRYAEVLKTVLSRNKKDIVQRIEAEVVVLNVALATLQSLISRTDEPSEYERITRVGLLRPLRSAFHDSPGAPQPCEPGVHEDVISQILTWSIDLSQPMVFWLYGDRRSTTSAIAQSIATRTHEAGRLASSFFFKWTGGAASCDFENLIPTIMYKIARFDKQFLRRIAKAITVEPDIRYKKTSDQITLLVKASFRDYEALFNPPLLIVIDALDTCNGLENPSVAQEICIFLQALSELPLHIKILITCRFSQVTALVSQHPNFPKYQTRELSLPIVREDQSQAKDALHMLGPVDIKILESLKPVFAARFDALGSADGCLEGTRVDVVAQIFDWCTTSTDRFSVYWLSGHAGTGKTTIAKTLSEKLLQQGHSGSWVMTFFASRFSTDRRDPLRILHSFVYELASIDVIAYRRVLAVLSSPEDITQRPLKQQVEELVHAVVKDLMNHRTLILVIDALDECFTEHGVEGGYLIREFSLLLANLPVKLVVTSRRETTLTTMFRDLPSEIVQLHEIEGTNVTEDVRRILVHGFGEIVNLNGMHGTNWPAARDIESIVERTGRLIIFATTLLKFIGNSRFGSPHTQLQSILQETSTNRRGYRFHAVDTLYLNVLKAAARPTPHEEFVDEHLCQRLRTLMGTIVLLQQPLSIPALASLLKRQEEELKRDVDALAAVVMLGPDKDSCGAPLLRIFHLSFRDFLLDRCDDMSFSIEKSMHHHEIAVYCLRNLNSTLRRDICRIGNPGLSNVDVCNPPVVSRIQEAVPDDTYYACLFWMVHLFSSMLPDKELLAAMQVFTDKHLFHWMELLSLIGHVFFAIQRLPEVSIWYKRHKKSKATSNNGLFQLVVLFEDSYRMLQGYQKIISTHALQVYYSALVTMPHCSLLNGMCGEVPQGHITLPCLKSPRLSEWRKNVLVLEAHNSNVTCVVFSPDGSRIASGSDNYIVSLWNAQTGHNIATLRGHTSLVTCVVFSPDGSQIASGSSDKTLRLWDAQTGHDIATLGGHTKAVRCVVFSPDGSQIASGSDDKTVRLWDAQTGCNITTLRSHTSHVTCVVFSPDGSQIASGSDDYTVRLWNAQMWCHIVTLRRHYNRVTSVVFSPDGLKIASGSDDKTVHLWNAHTTGKFQTGRHIVTLGGHTKAVRCVIFSPDGSQIASGADDKTVRLWNAQTGRHIATLTGHTNWVTCVVFSPDGSHIASASRDKTVRLWNAQTGRNIATLSTGHTPWITSHIFSSHAARVHMMPLHPISHFSCSSGAIAPSTSSSAPEFLLKNQDKTPSGHLMFDTQSHCIIWRSLVHPHEEGIKLCWLPAELCGDKYSTQKGMFAMASHVTYDLTIIDFTAMLSSLSNRGFIV